MERLSSHKHKQTTVERMISSHQIKRCMWVGMVLLLVHNNVVVFDSLFVSAQVVSVGDTVCVEGFVMDTLCIDMGTLLDNPDVVTLEQPEQHTFHCLLDVEECIDSGFNILAEPAEAGGLYTVAYRVDDAGRDLLVDLGRSTGQVGDFPSCSTCTADGDGALLTGFRAEVTGTVTSLGTELNPPVLTVTSAIPSNGLTEVCVRATATTTVPVESPSSSTTTRAPTSPQPDVVVATNAPTATPTIGPTAIPEVTSAPVATAISEATNAPVATIDTAPPPTTAPDQSPAPTVSASLQPASSTTTTTGTPSLLPAPSSSTNTFAAPAMVTNTTTTTTSAPVAAVPMSNTSTADSNANSAPVAVGDTVCVEGYIMDTLCIDLGTLLDNPDVKTLENPGEHSLHCLVDVSDCVESGYNVLREPDASGGLYTVSYRLDDAGRDQLVELGRSVGQCSTCTSNDKDQVKGFRAEVTGVVTSLDDPPTLRVTSVAHSNGRTDVCSGDGSGGSPSSGVASPTPAPPTSGSIRPTRLVASAVPLICALSVAFVYVF